MITVLAVDCGVLFAVSLGIWKRVTQDTVEWYEDPFTYFVLACVAVGAPFLLVRALAGLVYERTINMFLTMLLAIAGALVLRDLFAAAAIVFFFVLSECGSRSGASTTPPRRRAASAAFCPRR